MCARTIWHAIVFGSGQDSEARTRPSQTRPARLLSPGCAGDDQVGRDFGRPGDWLHDAADSANGRFLSIAERWRHSATSQHKPATWTHKRTALWEVYPHDGHPHRGAIRHIRKLPESGTGEDLCTFLLAAPSPGQCSIDPKTDSAGRPPSRWHEPAARTISKKPRRPA